MPSGTYKRPENYHPKSEFKKGHKINLGKKNNLGKHWKMSEKTKEKIKEALKGRKLSEEHKKNLKENNARYWLGKKFSKETIKKLRECHKGEKSYLWKGGKMAEYPEIERIRKSLEYKLWRKAIFERDNFTCQKYGIKGGKLHPHHIFNFADYPELRLAIDNGITLSEKAHREFHQIYGKQNNTKEQLEDFFQIFISKTK